MKSNSVNLEFSNFTNFVQVNFTKVSTLQFFGGNEIERHRETVWTTVHGTRIGM